MKSKLEGYISKTEDEILEKGKIANKISFFRLIVGVLIIITSIISFKDKINTLEGVAILIEAALFIMLVYKHNVIKKKIKYLNYKKDIADEYIKRINGKWNSFSDKGEEYVDLSHRYTSDLDIFGEESLFQLINTTNTFLGRKTLSDTLKGNNIKTENITLKQEAIEELSSDIEFCIEFQASSRLEKSTKKDPKPLIEYMKTQSGFLKSKILKYVINSIPVILIVSAFAAFTFKSKVLIFVALAALIVSIIFNGYFILKGGGLLDEVAPFKKNIKSYLNLIGLILNKDFKSKYLKDLKKELLKENIKADVSIRKLEKIVDNIDLIHNPLAYFILNIFFLWNYQCVFSIDKYKESYGRYIEGYIKSIGKIEEAMSLCVIKQVNKDAALPKITNHNNCYIKCENLGHPLIQSENRVTNNIKIENEILILTGSNMSGKTTFLRTAGINMVLAYSGTYTISTCLECSNMEIITSMRISDSLGKGISTFYAELIRIKEILDFSKKKVPMMFFVDEIFRGTNSSDRILGAINVVENLSLNAACGIVSTHDFELCDMEKISNIRNYHFEEYYENKKIYFDYKIRSGRSTTKNAKFLMNMVGIEIKDN